MKHALLSFKALFFGLLSFVFLSIISCSEEQKELENTALENEQLIFKTTLNSHAVAVSNTTVTISAGDDVQAYIDALYNTYGVNGNTCTLILSAGDYVLSESLVIRSYLTLKGEDGANRSDIVFKLNNSSFNEPMITSSGTLESVTLKNFKIRGNIESSEQNLDPSYHTTSGKAISEGKRIALFGIYIYGGGEDYASAEVKDLTIENIEVRNCSMGIQIKGSRDLFCKDLKLHNNGMIQKYYHNMYLRRAFSCHIRESEMYSSATGNGINISQSDDVTVKYLNNHDNYWRGIRIEGESGWIVDDIDVFSNTCTNNGDAGFRFYNISGGNISTNTSSGNNPNLKSSNVSGVTWNNNVGF